MGKCQGKTLGELAASTLSQEVSLGRAVRLIFERTVTQLETDRIGQRLALFVLSLRKAESCN